MAQDAAKKLQLVPHAYGCGLPTAMGLKCMQAGTTGQIEKNFPTQAARWRRIFATAPNPAPNTVEFATKFVANVWGVRGRRYDDGLARFCTTEYEPPDEDNVPPAAHASGTGCRGAVASAGSPAVARVGRGE